MGLETSYLNISEYVIYKNDRTLLR